MCIIAAKYFPEVGWVGVKNRDRNYVPELTFKREDVAGLERLLYTDKITQYREGLNDDGVCVLSASLMVINDEKEVKEPNKSHSGDGERISQALKLPTVDKALKFLIKSKLTGNTIVFDKDTMYLLEASNRGEGSDAEYVFKVRKVPHGEVVVRTNHGIDLPWAGYQPDASNPQEALSRKSSESRLKIAERVTKKAKTPLAILDLLCARYSDDPQMNALRTATDKKKMRTTAQIMLIPAERTMYVRPVQSSIDFNFWKMDDPEADTWVEILSNKPLWESHGKGANGRSKMRHTA